MGGCLRADIIEAALKVKRRVIVEPEAEAELQAAAEWYEGQQAGLGLDLLESVAAAQDVVARGEHGVPAPRIATGARRAPVPRLPLWIVFVERMTEVLVVAYAHERRRPGYWLVRMPDRKR